MNMVDIIGKQVHGNMLADTEIKFIINGYTNGSIPDYQMSAFLMAVCFNGFNDKQTAYMTKCMAESGNMLDLSGIDGIVTDKHSTGGVGDKTSLAVVPIAAACGVKTAKMSGRGLGFTGGTIDKLEAIPGFNTSVSFDKFIEQVNKVGAAIIAQTENLAPADKKIYALRDVTGTIDCIPLIASSIMSKKLASGADAIVLDVKYGSGAFMKTKEQARKLADLMVNIGQNNGKRMKALITDMNMPLGEAVGNSLEVTEAVNTLKGIGPHDFQNLCISLAASMIEISTDGISYEKCVEMAENSIRSGAAFEKFRQMVNAQGGNTDYIYNTDLFEKAKYIREIKAKKSGVISYMNTEQIGIISRNLGAGRKKLGDKIDFSAGLMIKNKNGDSVNSNDIIAVLYTNNENYAEIAENEYLNSIQIK